MYNCIHQQLNTERVSKQPGMLWGELIHGLQRDPSRLPPLHLPAPQGHQHPHIVLHRRVRAHVQRYRCLKNIIKFTKMTV